MNFKAQTSFRKNDFTHPTHTFLVFQTHDEALEYAELRASRSLLIADYRVVESNEAVSHVMMDGRARRLWEVA